MASSVVVTSVARNLTATGDAAPSVNKRGELIRAWPWHLQLAHEGKVFVCGAGTVTTPITIANTALDATLPELMIRVPGATTIIPLYIHCYYEATGAVLPEGGAYFSLTDPGNGTSSAADRVLVNMKSRGGTSACTVRQLVTTTPTFISATEFWRFGEPADLDGTVTGESGFTWDYQRNGDVPIIVGDATLNIHMAAPTSGSGYITVVFAEFSTSSFLG